MQVLASCELLNSFVSAAKVFFLFDWSSFRLDCLSPLGVLPSSALSLATNSSSCCPRSSSCLHVRHSATELNKDWSLEVMLASVHQGLLGHAALSPEGKLSKPIHKIFQQLIMSLLCAQQGVYVDLKVFLEEARQEEPLQIAPAFDGSLR